MSEDAKTMEQLMVELAEARKTLDDAVEEENKASNRRRDARLTHCSRGHACRANP